MINTGNIKVKKNLDNPDSLDINSWIRGYDTANRGGTTMILAKPGSIQCYMTLNKGLNSFRGAKAYWWVWRDGGPLCRYGEDDV